MSIDPAAANASPESAVPPIAVGGPDRVAAVVSAWKTRLLDLSKRNRALNFRSSKVSTVAIVDEQPAEVFRQLQLRRDAMRFKAAPEPPESSDKAAATSADRAVSGDAESGGMAPAGEGD
jgi:Protein of unknown function (DUF4011)